jgi:hypothetical protein
VPGLHITVSPLYKQQCFFLRKVTKSSRREIQKILALTKAAEHHSRFRGLRSKPTKTYDKAEICSS